MAGNSKQGDMVRAFPSVLLAMTLVAIFLLAPEAKAQMVIGTDEPQPVPSAPHDETGAFYVAEPVAIDEVRQLVASDERMQEISNREEGEIPAESADDYDIGNEIAWLAVQMAGVASDLDASLYAPGANPWAQIDDSRLANLFAVMDATLGAYGGNNAYGSCNQATCGVIAAVADMDTIPFDAASGNPSYMQAYLRAHPETYERVYPDAESDLRPGDIFVTTDRFTHTAIYVGNELVQEKFPGSSGNLYQAGYQEGDHARYAQIDTIGMSDIKWAGYEVYRVRRRNEDARYPAVDYREIVRETQTRMDGLPG